MGTINHEDRNDDYGFNGFTHICKFSKNKNNLHVIGCIKNDGRFYIAKTIDHDTLKVELLAKCKYKDTTYNYTFLDFCIIFVMCLFIFFWVKEIKYEFLSKNFLIANKF